MKLQVQLGINASEAQSGGHEYRMPRKPNLGITKLFALTHKSLTSLGIVSR